MKALVTGAGGQLGQALIGTASKDIEVIAATHGELDISDRNAVFRFLERGRPEVVINAAAYTQVDKAETLIENARRINTEGPHHLAKGALNIGARLIHISTDFVFDGNASTPYKPTADTHPLSVYGTTKREGERAVLDTIPANSAIVRTAWLYAPRGHNFVHTMLRLMRERDSIAVVADQVGTPTSARSLANVLWAVAKHPEVRHIHHWTDAGVASWYDFATAIAEEASAIGLITRPVAVRPIATSEYPTPARRPPYSVLDTSSLDCLGIPPVHWRQHLRGALKEIQNG